MTYMQFHLAFTLPPVAAMIVLYLICFRTRAFDKGKPGALMRWPVIALLAHVVMAVLYTSPWDNYLVANGVWGYPEGKVIATIGHVPIEEYLFFILQTVITGLFLLTLGFRFKELNAPKVTESRILRPIVACVFVSVAALGLVLSNVSWGSYLGLILVWACPILAIQWGFGGDLILRRAKLWAVALSIPTIYFWLADRIAIGLNIWWISPEHTTGILLLGLPLEEAVFFLITNLMVVSGMLLVLEPESRARLREILKTPGFWWKATLVMWVISMLPTPLFPKLFPLFSYLSTALLAIGVFGAVKALIGNKAFVLAIVTIVFGVAIELLGTRTGVPFGDYTYSAPGPTIFGVPILVILGWWAFTIVAIAAAPDRGIRWLAPLFLVAWDLGLDPLMVHQGFWQFDPAGKYFGVPISNFMGWYVAGVILVSILLRIEPRLRCQGLKSLRIVFVAQGFLMVVGLIIFKLHAAALVGFVAIMALTLLWTPLTQKIRLLRQSV